MSGDDHQTQCLHQPCSKGQKCCHSLDLGLAYCCSEFTEFFYVGVMIGGGVLIALLIVICYLCMRRAERSLEEAARLEAAKNLSNSTVTPPGGSSSSSSSGSGGGGNEASDDSSYSAHLSLEDFNIPPPAYDQVVSPNDVRRFHSCDPQIMLTSQGDSLDVTSILGRQLSEGHRNSGPSFAHDPSQAKFFEGLPPLPPLHDSDSKLPTYYEYTYLTSPNLCTRQQSSQPDASSSPTPEVEPSRGDSERPQHETVTIEQNNEIYFSYNRNNPTKFDPAHLTNIPICPALLRLSIPTQVDDGTGIVTGALVNDTHQTNTVRMSSSREGEGGTFSEITPVVSRQESDQDTNTTCATSDENEILSEERRCEEVEKERDGGEARRSETVVTGGSQMSSEDEEIKCGDIERQDDVEDKNNDNDDAEETA